MKKLALVLLLIAGTCITALAAAPANQDSTGKDTTTVASKNKGDNATKSLNEKPQPSSKANSKPCIPIDGGIRPVLGWVLIISTAFLFFVIAARSNLLKDAITDKVAFLAEANKTIKYKNETDPGKVTRPYSLSRSQLGLWTVVIACSYLYMQLCRHCCITPIDIDKNLLELMGISAGTAAIGSVIDSSNNQVPHHQDGPSEGIVKDILSDQNGISVHRFQNVIWTIIAVTIFICQLPDVSCGSLPKLDDTLIALTGISSLTYLGLKVNENKPPAPPVVPGANGHI